ncbi:MAG: hypothetical protein KIT31_36535 [Deltaproteobacteria bacterium]|nr:hypothetical protein [Deltaproteobacteria bacterium]
MRLAAVAAAVVAAGALTSACRTAAPGDPTMRALFRDLERQVTVAAATGWGADRLEIDAQLEAALDSTCRVDPLARRLLRRWLDDRIALAGGPVEQAYRARGKNLDRVEGLLVLTRVRMLLDRAEEHALDCPFWLEPEHDFRGRQVSQHRFILTFGGGGKAIAVAQGDQTNLSFGGAGRLLVGRMFRDGDGLFTGVELGGNAVFARAGADGERSLELGADLVVPLVYRRAMTNTYVELAAGYLGHTSEANFGAFDHGIHLGLGVGARALRTRFLFPGAAFGISWERTFVAGDDLTSIKVGFRVAFDLHL